MLIAKLPVPNPTAIFAVALLLGVVLLGLGIVARTSWIAAVALAATWAVECAWHALHFSNGHALLALGWYAVFFLVFVAYPFFSTQERAASVGDRSALRAAALLARRHPGRLRLSAFAQWPPPRRLRVAVCGRALAPDRETRDRARVGRCAAGLAGWGGVAFPELDRADPIRSRMGHAGLGVGRLRAPHALPACAQRRAAAGGRGFARDSIR